MHSIVGRESPMGLGHMFLSVVRRVRLRFGGNHEGLDVKILKILGCRWLCRMFYLWRDQTGPCC